MDKNRLFRVLEFNISYTVPIANWAKLANWQTIFFFCNWGHVLLCINCNARISLINSAFFNADSTYGDEKEFAIENGYTVVDPATVISTHMSELIKRNAEDLLTRQEVQTLIDKIKVDFPIIVDDVFKVATVGSNPR